MAKYIIDRFEGDKAVCEQEDKTFIDILKSLLPSGAKEGDCLDFDGTSYALDADGNKERHARIQNKMDSVFKD